MNPSVPIVWPSERDDKEGMLNMIKTIKLTSALTAISLLMIATSVTAQNNPANSTATSASDQSAAEQRAHDQFETALLYMDATDIDRTRSINPLQLTETQLHEMEALLVKTQDNFDQQTLQEQEKLLLPLAPEIKSVQKEVLTGKSIPTDFDKKMIKISLKLLHLRQNLNLQDIATVSEGLHKIFTKDQIKLAADMEKSAPTTQTYNPNATEAQWFNLWVSQVLLDYPHIIPLIKAMEKAQADKTATSPSSTQSGTGK